MQSTGYCSYPFARLEATKVAALCRRRDALQASETGKGGARIHTRQANGQLLNLCKQLGHFVGNLALIAPLHHNLTRVLPVTLLCY